MDPIANSSVNKNRGTKLSTSSVNNNSNSSSGRAITPTGNNANGNGKGSSPSHTKQQYQNHLPTPSPPAAAALATIQSKAQQKPLLVPGPASSGQTQQKIQTQQQIISLPNPLGRNRPTTTTNSSKQNGLVAYKNPGQLFPNLDPRNFPRPMTTSAMAHFNGSLGARATGTKSLLGIDRSKNLRAFVEKAMAEHKVFTCVGVYPAIKNALKKRGWVEKQGPLAIVRSANTAMFREMESRAAPEDESDSAWVSRNLRDYPPDFVWVIRRDNIDWKSLHKDQVINRFPKAWFTTKVGIVACLQQLHWFSEAGVSDTFFPRCYRLCLEDEKHAFQDDYRLTACMSYLRHFVEQVEARGIINMVDMMSKITPLSIDFAVRQVSYYIKMRRHEDIDWGQPPQYSTQYWEAFLDQYYKVVHEKRRIRFDSPESIKERYENAKMILSRLQKWWPQAHFDGVYNMWICKPGARSRGKGIVIFNTLEKIMDLLNHNNYRESNWVVQKYMERPLLVYKTKFDMRQWFIITDWTPLTVWFYKESYVRFCTKPYVLEDFHESIHLCNNAIQCRYQNSEQRDSALPDENMWDCYTFQSYLKTIGRLDEWPKIYEGMKQAIIGVLLSSQENVETRRGCFELYGADFMLAEDFKPWLIEINSCPCMAPSTSVTARMCAQCLDDCIKVVIDRKANKNADTGMFELIYKQNPSAIQVQQFTGHDLVVHGKKLTRDIDWPSVMIPRSLHNRRNTGTVAISQMTRQPSSMAPPHQQENLTFADLLQKLRMKNASIMQRFVNKSQASTLAAITKDGSDEKIISDILNKLRSLSKQNRERGEQESVNNLNGIIPGMKKVYPSPSKSGSGSKTKHPTTMTALMKSKAKALGTSGDKEESAASTFLAKYASNASAFADLVKLGQELRKEGNDPERPSSSESGKGTKRPRSPTSRNPYLPSPQTAKTMDEVRSAMIEKYGKTCNTNDLINDLEQLELCNSSRGEEVSNFVEESTNAANAIIEASPPLSPPNSNPNQIPCPFPYLLSTRPSSETIDPINLERFEDNPHSQSNESKTRVGSEINPPAKIYNSVYMVYPVRPDHEQAPESINNKDKNSHQQFQHQILDKKIKNKSTKNHPDPAEVILSPKESMPLIDLESPKETRPNTPLLIPYIQEFSPTNNASSSSVTPSVPNQGNLLHVQCDIANNNTFIVQEFFPPKHPFHDKSSQESSEDSLDDFILFHASTNLIPLLNPSCLENSLGPPSMASVNKKDKGKNITNSRSLTHHRHHYHHRYSLPRFPCHRIALQPLKLSGRRSGPTLPLKKINLKLS